MEVKGINSTRCNSSMELAEGKKVNEFFLTKNLVDAILKKLEDYNLKKQKTLKFKRSSI